MLMKNTGGAVRIKATLLVDPPVEGSGRVATYAVIEAGATVELKEGYCQPMLAANGSRAPSVIEKIARNFVPADPDVAAQWQKAPTKQWEPPRYQVTAEELLAMGVAPRVAKLQAAHAAAKAAAAEKVSRRIAETFRATVEPAPVVEEPAPVVEEPAPVVEAVPPDSEPTKPEKAPKRK